MGREINTDELGQVIQDLVVTLRLEKKVPLCLLLPPVCIGNYTSTTPSWDYYRLRSAWLNTTHYSGTNQVMNPNPSTRTSTHTILQDWHDMKRCAVDFVKVLDSVMK